jgi:hypothetical protein
LSKSGVVSFKAGGGAVTFKAGAVLLSKGGAVLLSESGGVPFKSGAVLLSEAGPVIFNDAGGGDGGVNVELPTTVVLPMIIAFPSNKIAVAPWFSVKVLVTVVGGCVTV